MTINDLVMSVLGMPEIKRLMLPVEQGGLGVDLADLSDDLKRRANDAVLEVVMAYHWDFAIKETTKTLTVGTAEYTLQGDDNNCMSIYHIRKTVDGTEIIGLNLNQANVKRNDYTSIPACMYYYNSGRDGNYPKVTFLGSPEEAISVTYQFWDSKISIGELAPEFNTVLVNCLAKYFVPKLTGTYEDSLVNVISGYEKDNHDINVAELDPQIKYQNRYRNSLNGYL